MKSVLSTCVFTLVLAIACLGFAPALQAQTLTISCANAIGEAGVPYSSAVTASGGVAPYTFSITAGALPPGLTMNTSTGAITGTPTQAGTFNYKAKAVDSKGNTAIGVCQIKVASPVEIDCPNHGKNIGEVGVPFSVKVPAIKGVPPYTFAIVGGSLPPGLSLNPNTGVISGVPTQAGNFFFVMQVTDSLGGTFTLKCEIQITNTPPLTLACPPGTPQVGVPYNSALVATGGVPPYTFSIISGSLPPGLTLNPSTGAITGTPTTFGSYSFTAQVVDSTGSKAGTATTTCSLIVTPPAIHLTCPAGTAQVGVPYSSSLVATGGEPPYTFSIITGSLPPGLVLNPSTGAISGTPTTYGTYTFTAQVVDSRNNSAGTTTASCTIVVAPPALSLTCPSGTAQVGVPYSSSLVATGGEPPYTFSIITGSLPPGLVLNPSTGAISGTPTTYGTYTFTAQVVDSRNNSAGTTTASCTIVVAPPALSLTCPSGTAQVGVPYSSSLVATGGEPPYTFSIITGSLPPGLTLNPSTGAISGTPTTYGTYTFTAQVVDSRNNSAGTTTASCTIVVAPPTLSLTCPSGTAQVGVPYSSSLVATGGEPPYTFSIITGSLPPGLVLNPSTGAISGTPTTYGTYTFTAQVVDSRNNSAGTTTASCTIVVAPPTLSLTCPAGTAQVGVPYSSSLVATGGEPPYTFSIITGSLPPGLTLNPSTGAISGTPTTYGTYTFTAQVVDSRNNSAGTTTASCTIVVAPPTLSLTCPSGTAQVGVPYSSSLVATGGEPPYTFSIITGSLPPGLVLNPSTGAISGTPTTYGTYTFTAQVVDSRNNSAGTTTASCTIVVAPPALSLTCPSGTAQVGVPYSSSLVATGGEPPYTFSIITGSLPPGLVLNPSTGAISGTPTTYGTYTFTAQVVDSRNNSAGTTTASCTIVVAPPALSLTCPSGTAQVGVPYSSSLVATGGEPPYTFSIITGSLPPGLTLNPSTGAISGTPTTYGTYTFTAQVVDSRNNSAGTTTASCTIVVAPPTLSLTCPSGTAQVGVAYSSSLVATGGEPPYTFSIITGSLPPGLTLNPSTGAITGTPTTYGTYTFTAQVVDSRNNSAGTTTASCTIVVAPPTLSLTCPSGTAQVGVAYSSSLVATGGEPPYTFSIITGSLPPGLTLNPSTGAITGTPTTYGTYTFTAQVVDSRNNSAGTTTASCTIVVAPPTLSLTCPSGTAQVGVAYSSSLVATGGEPPYTFSIITGSLPPGLTLNPSTGAITGTPTTYGTYTFTAQVVDSRNNSAGTATASCTIVVAPPAITLTCPASTGQVGVAYSSALLATGGVPPYTFSIISGSLPPGLTLNPSTGAITGTPTTYGTFNFTAKVVDSTNTSAGTTTANCSIVIQPPQLTATCASGTGEVGLAYSSSVGVTGGVPPYTFSISAGALPPGLTLNPTTGAITGTPTSQGTFSYSVEVTDSASHSITISCTIVISTCGSALVPVTYNVNENNSVGEIAWFNSHLTALQGNIPTSTFEIYISGGQITFGPETLSVPDSVITFSSTATCSSVAFNTAGNNWQVTVPLSYASKADEIFAAGIAYEIPSGFPNNVNNVTWSANISASAPGLQVTWQYGVSNWLTSAKGTTFPNLTESPFVPDYNGMMVLAAHNAPDCYGTNGDHAGAPEFSGRGNVLTGGGSGGGGSNWTGSWSSTPGTVLVCQPSGTPGACVASSINQAIQPNSAFAAIGLQGSNFQLSSGPLQVTGNLGIGQNGIFALSGGATLNATLYADPTASVSISGGGSSLTGGTVTQSMSPLQTAALALSNSAAAQTPTQTLPSIISSTTITGNGGLNVINVTGTFHLSGGANLVISGGTADVFIINAANGLQLDGGSNILLSGVNPVQVLFNFPPGSSGQVQTSGKADTAGIFLAPTLQMQINGGYHNSEFISGGQLSFQSNPQVTAPQCTQ